MITNEKNPVEFAMMAYGLEETRDHIDELLGEIDKDEFCDAEFAVCMAHIYAHLNRVWNARHLERGYTYAEREQFNKFPTDLTPTD